MSILPRSFAERITFFNLRLAPWGKDPVGIGLTAAQVVEITNATTDAGAALDAAELARANAQAATIDLRAAVSEMDRVGRTGIAMIKAFARAQVDPNAVYSSALLPPPDTEPTPAPPPSVPTNIITTLNNDGSLTLSWHAHNAAPSSGAFFAIHRKLEGESGFTLIASLGIKKYVDLGLPLGVKHATYMIQAWRGTKPSPFSEQATIQFGQILPAPAPGITPGITPGINPGNIAVA